MVRSRRKTSASLAVVLSALLHGAVLVGLSRVAPTPAVPAADRDMVVDLNPPEDLSAAPAPFATRRTTPFRRPASLPAPLSLAPTRRPEPRPAAPSPAPPSRAAAASRGPGASASRAGVRSGGPATVEAGAEGGGLREALRTSVGCSHADFLKLTPAERDACSRAFARQAALVTAQRVDPIVSIRKRDYYDAVRQAYQNLHDPSTPLDEGPGGEGGESPGHGPAYGCIHGKCGVISQGVVTEEAGITPP